VENPKRNPLRYALTFPTFLNILRKERPNVVITTGAGVAVPVCLIAKYLFGAKIIFIESFSRIFEPSQTGRLLYNFADLFIVQWDSLMEKYGPKAVYGGTIL
jgi:UDP-N-acetylglucosamine:LPS N-acetylglucosamine transferase